MTQQKQSFFEKLTGIKRVDDKGGEEFSINASGTTITESGDSQVDRDFAPASFKINEESYQVPNNQLNYEREMEVSSSTAQQQPAQTPASTPAGTQPTSTEEDDDLEGQLTIDVYQTDEEIVIKSTIAGVKPEDLDVSINNDMVTIRGERKQDDEISPDNYYYQECYWGQFSRSIILPVEIVADKAEAIMKNGILTLKLPKADTTKTRKIQVRGF